MNHLTESIIGCAIEVHRHLGPGLLEGTYEEAHCIEFADAGWKFHRQLAVPVIYKGRRIGEYRLDLLVEDLVVVEIKSVERFEPIFRGPGSNLFESYRQEGWALDKLQLQASEGRR